MTIYIQVKNIYGKDFFYPRNFVNELQTLTGAKTLNNKQMRALQAMGFKFEVITQKIEV